MSVSMNLLTLFFRLLALPLRLAEAVGLYGLYKRFFPFLMYRMTSSYNRKMREDKRNLFRSLPEFGTSAGPLTILEIGCGTGANFGFYPAGCRVVCTDPNPHFRKYLRKSIAECEHVSFDRFVVASGEDLGSVEDGSVDAVVSTLVLCSVNDVPRTLREAHRVLRPGGAFYFMEHVVAEPSSWTFFLQHVIQPLWYYCGDGCELTRATWSDLEAAGFSQLKLRHVRAPVMLLIRPHVVGYAVK